MSKKDLNMSSKVFYLMIHAGYFSCTAQMLATFILEWITKKRHLLVLDSSLLLEYWHSSWVHSINEKKRKREYQRLFLLTMQEEYKTTIRPELADKDIHCPYRNRETILLLNWHDFFLYTYGSLLCLSLNIILGKGTIGYSLY